jgi:hypothetical protein
MFPYEISKIIKKYFPRLNQPVKEVVFLTRVSSFLHNENRICECRDSPFTQVKQLRVFENITVARNGSQKRNHDGNIGAVCCKFSV